MNTSGGTNCISKDLSGVGMGITVGLEEGEDRRRLGSGWWKSVEVFGERGWIVVWREGDGLEFGERG